MAQEVDIEIPPDRSSETQWSQLVKIAGGILSALVVVFLLGRNIVIRPQKPEFTLQDVTLYDFNVSVNPSLLSSKFLVTIWLRNPNARIGIYYETLVGYAAYQNLQVTSRTEIPLTYEGHKRADVWSVLISGTSVPLAPYIGEALRQDWGNQTVVIVIKLEGQVRWKLGSLVKGGYHITVRCPAYLTFGVYFTGFFVGSNTIKYQLLQICNVDFSK